MFARNFLGKTWSVFPFRKAFRFIRSHFLLDKPLSHDGVADIAAVYQAIRNGRIFVSLDYFRPARGFSFVINLDGKILHLGDEAEFGHSARASISTPFPGKIHLLRNGEIIAETRGVSLETDLRRQGVYRVEVYNQAFGRFRPWIFSNPIFIR